uniref:Uncharacterized protein n=1 Tax=Timema douglasi TaxID=61478 RepID=A0A7R8Z5M2_TIMDO|nr:unnamed protein product [Timema douglasi]
MHSWFNTLTLKDELKSALVGSVGSVARSKQTLRPAQWHHLASITWVERTRYRRFTTTSVSRVRCLNDATARRDIVTVLDQDCESSNDSIHRFHSIVHSQHKDVSGGGCPYPRHVKTCIVFNERKEIPSIKRILWDGGREGERHGVASQPTKVSFRVNKNRCITETIQTSISPSSEVELNATSALAKYATEAGQGP